MNERFVRVGDIEICYESLGDPAQPTVVPIMGLDLTTDCGATTSALVARGFHVVRSDNRDVGRSTHVTGPGRTAWQFRRRRAAPVHTLGDMADDTAGSITRVEPRGAHVVGASPGSVVTQEVAIRHPESPARSSRSWGGPATAAPAGCAGDASPTSCGRPPPTPSRR